MEGWTILRRSERRPDALRAPNFLRLSLWKAMNSRDPAPAAWPAATPSTFPPKSLESLDC